MTTLQLEWPETWDALACTYWREDPRAGETRYVERGGPGDPGTPQNDAGYALWGLRRYAARVGELHAGREYSHAVLDQAAAAEVIYHWRRQSSFRRPVAALVKCWGNLPHERPERLEEARCSETNGGGSAGSGSARSSSAPCTGTVSSSPSATRRQSPQSTSGSVSRECPTACRLGDLLPTTRRVPGVSGSSAKGKH